jgi:hypothetical protein
MPLPGLSNVRFTGRIWIKAPLLRLAQQRNGKPQKCDRATKEVVETLALTPALFPGDRGNVRRLA